jgi:anti-sigma regulatory factor (Ser/Thr protein kinase)
MQKPPGTDQTAVDHTLEQRPDELWRLQFATALAELGANIVRYAYSSQPTPGPMQLRLQAYSDRVEAHFTDFGTVFVAPSAPPAAPRQPTLPNVEEGGEVTGIPEGGYGLPLIRAVVDQLDYTRTDSGENHWRLVKQM